MTDDIVEYLRTQEPGEAVAAAIVQFLREDSYLLEVDANERSMSHRFGMFLQLQLPEWHVDCEYNRDGVDPKRIEHLGLRPDDEDTESKTVFPDIIAHQRGTDENYLVIEFKKSTSSVDRRVDYAKLRGYQHSLGYRYALFVELSAGGKSGIEYVEWVSV